MTDDATWITAEQMYRSMAIAGDIDPDNATVAEIESILDELVEAEFWETDGDGRYRVASAAVGFDFLADYAPTDREQ